MAFYNFNNLVANISSGGYAKANKFEAEILFPANVPGANISSRIVSLKVKTLTLPGRNITTTTNDTIYGPTHELAGGLSYADSIDVTFYLAENLDEKKRFDAWQEYIYSPRTYELNFYERYVGTMNIYQLGDDLDRKYGVSLKEVFPKTINPLEYSNESASGVLDLTVSFAFKEWEELDDLGNPKKPKPPAVAETVQTIHKPFTLAESDTGYDPARAGTTAEYRSTLQNADVDTMGGV